ncbi:MAG: DUF6335 family protein [Oculatellaceae cyanobacterium Prado106]|nr:DUF6335 family protein [Oculatellaceae cyanobacterium Prado106]
MDFAPESEAIHLAPSGRMTDVDTELSDELHEVQDLAILTGGDRDADPYLAQVVGEEAIGGSTPMPDQNVVEDLARSVGIEMLDQEILHTHEILEYRDSHRWELNPQSSEDYEEDKGNDIRET